MYSLSRANCAIDTEAETEAWFVKASSAGLTKVDLLKTVAPLGITAAQSIETPLL